MIRNIYILLLLSLSFGTVTDIDGNVYETVQIGEQLWMAENLKVTHYRNGDAISTGHSNSEWSMLEIGAYAVYDEFYADIYGNVYNWYVVGDERGVCPIGLSVPSDEEFKNLEMELGMSEAEANSVGWRGTNEGSKLAGNADLWGGGIDGDLENDSEFGTSGFNALPGSYRQSNTGYFHSPSGGRGKFWTSSVTSSSHAKNRELYYVASNIGRYGYNKKTGFSIRCMATTGCTDPEACNYSPDATMDDGSCLGPFLCDDGITLECNLEDCCDLGDINCDGELNVLDVTLAVNMIISAVYDEAADVDENSELNILDVVIIVNWILFGPPYGTVNDIDGNIYETLQIGEQVWMVENLKTSHYNDGSEIPTGYSATDWINLDSGAYSLYNDDSYIAETYGFLYNWYAAASDSLCPIGWHLPSHEEWTILTDFLAPEGIESPGNNSVAGGLMKSTGTIEDEDGLWYSPNTGATNESKFNALPNGYRYSQYYQLGVYGWFWSSNSLGANGAYSFWLKHDSAEAGGAITNSEKGLAVRCLKD